jgi:DNA-binding MarR family transcriptional regulator
MRPDGNVLWLLGRASLWAHHVMNASFAVTGLRKLHYIVLANLNHRTAATQAELCRATGIDRSDMVALLNDLERDSYVRRAPDPDNRRRNIVTLTSAGHDMLARLDALAAEARDTILAPLTSAERDRLTRYLERIVQEGKP